jgi:esterase/lipase superfamily enzyme
MTPPPRRIALSSRRLSVLLALVAVLFGLAGCAGRPGAGSLVPTAASAPGAKSVTLLVATDRGDADVAGSGGGRAALRYEQLTVSIPPGHKPGTIEWSEETARDPAKSFVVTGRQPLSEEGFRRAVAAGAKEGETAGVFVHGYNYSLAEAAFRLAQLSSDSARVGAPILFSWPSEAAVTGYVADRDAVAYARDDLAHVLTLVAAARPRGQITLAGHSMGCWLVMETLRQFRLEGRDDLVARFEVALAAPDIDVDVFRRQLAVVGRLSPPLTILVSPDDRALLASGRLAGGHTRLGLVDVHDPRLLEIAQRDGLRIVDISSLEASDGTRHDRFVRFAAFQSREMGGDGNAVGSLQQAGAFVFNAAGAAVASPFTLAGRVIAGE